jgi:hypothetical protein
MGTGHEGTTKAAIVDAKLLRPIRDRSQEAQMDLMVIRARAALVKARTSLINPVRGFTKATGDRLAVVRKPGILLHRFWVTEAAFCRQSRGCVINGAKAGSIPLPVPGHPVRLT